MFRASLFALAAAAYVSAVELTIPTGAALIADEYIVTLRANTSDADHAMLAAKLGGPVITIDTFRAVTAGFDKKTLEWVLQHELVEAVEQNSVVQALQACNANQGSPVSWGQVRSTRASPVGQSTFAHNRQWGTGVDAYVLDTGIRCTHNEFTGRCIFGANYAGGANTDNNGHGTHCAGTIGGTTYGIAKSVQLIAVKVLADNGSGSVAGIVNGVSWANSQRQTRGRPGVLSLSLGGGVSAAMDNAVNSAFQGGSHVAVASGNSNADACNSSPARAANPITVSSTELGSSGGANVDRKSSFSNWGSCVDIWAPGSSITAAYSTSDTAISTLSGTSMACPHVAGALVVRLTTNPNSTPAAAKTYITTTTSVVGIVQNVPTSGPNRMLQIPCQ